ncbi:hypothetical protein GWO43_10755, partial [candidate division KSB1 bacterium]|nr:hypothetical protein [candidate division Zixibacteria bacterium]NIR48906.1 hypothetical protein [candidate division KSB1 bacterium]NIS24416.1 hypothetical protein [candidate division KSB1 bacterium]NIT71351.1 hypothetical protein [candidate division KSB1 bacterium]NIU25031.1 hypothetical protein [candidate division KSB1 bacterium]
MTRKKFLFILSLLVVFALALTACGGNNTPTNEEPMNEEPVNEEPVNEEPMDEEPVDEEPMDEPTAMKNPGDPFWTDAERQALAAALDREALVDRVFEGRNIPAYHMVPTGYPYATEPF